MTPMPARALSLTLFVAALGTIPAHSLQATQNRSPVDRREPARGNGSDAVEIVRGNQIVRRVAFEAIKKAATGEITRYGQRFAATPFDAVLTLAGIPPGARVRVVGEEGEMILGSTSGDEDPTRYVVIFNMRSLPVLTPSPGVGGGAGDGTGAAGRPSGRSEGSALPPAGSGGGNRGGRAGGDRGGQLPPPGSGGGPRDSGSRTPGDLPPPGSGGGQTRAGGGAGNGAGPGLPPGFGQLKEVRSFTRIQVVN